MIYPSIRIEGAILSPDILDRLEDLPGQKPSDFGLDSSVKVKDDIARAWADAQDYWRIFQRKFESLREGAAATTETRQQWIIPLLGLLGYQLDYHARGTELNGKTYTISHRATNRGQAPVQIVGYGEDAGLDRKPQNARMSAHGVVQEYLNLSEQLYGIVTNGRVLRLLRDSSRLIKLSFVEFDLDRIFTDGLFADFALFYRLLHATRLPVSNDATAESCIERYHQDSLESGARIREGLSGAVEHAILDFANGFLSHRDNTELRSAIEDGRLKADEFYQNLLRLIYRLLFLMVIEERDLVFPANDENRQKRGIYRNFYSLQRLRHLSEKRYLADARRHDLWLSLLATFRLFESTGPGARLEIGPLAGDLFGSGAIGSLSSCTLGNDVLLNCLRSLSVYEHPENRQQIRVNYAALNVEEFGSVYEGLLEYEPAFGSDGQRKEFAFRAGDERARTGSHYTPDDLVQPLIKHSLDYLIAERLKAENPEAALLDLRVADIACGSGHILLAAARRIATELAIIRTGEEQPSPSAYRTALRGVIRNCIYGVDYNPLAVELCKVALWLEAHIPGQPLNFLDHHIKCGNSIVGFVHRNELDRGVPDEAFATMSGDDRDLASDLRKKNRRERKDREHGQHQLGPSVSSQLNVFTSRWDLLSALPERTPQEIADKKTAFAALANSLEAFTLEQVAAIPIAQFYIQKKNINRTELVTDAEFRRYWEEGRLPIGEGAANAWSTAHERRVFHWFLEFPDVIARGGFDCILGNPPYLGRGGLRSVLGNAFCAYAQYEFAPSGISDLVVFFLRRSYSLLRGGGFTGLITTNSIRDGAVREGGLEVVLSSGGSIVFAIKAIRWPGRANLFVSLLTIAKATWNGNRLLDGQAVRFISPSLDEEAVDKPAALRESRGRIFQGSIVRGEGFLVSKAESAAMISASSRNQEVLFPVLNGHEVNNEPSQSANRCVINFFGWPEAISASYHEPFARLEALVKPERQGTGQPWWLFWRPRVELYAELAHLQQCFVAAATTKYLNFSSASPRQVFTHALFVFATDRWDLYCVVQSTLHEVWARKYSGSLETRLRYSPSDCFENFAFPGGLWQIASVSLVEIAKQYYEHRKSLMLSLWLGLTDIYNLFHARGLSPAMVQEVSKKSPEEAERGCAGLLHLRRLHRELDLAVRDAYGWDFDLGHDIHDVETLPENDHTRYTISPVARKEVLHRLRELNYQRAAEEAASVPLSKVDSRKRRVRDVQDQVSLVESVRPIPAMPHVVPALSFELQAPLLLLALLHASGAAASRVELARAFALLSDPDLLSKHVPADSAEVTAQWASRAVSRSASAGTFTNVLTDLASRDVIRIEVDAQTSRTIVTTTSLTPPEDQLDPWFRFEARLALRVIDNLASDGSESLDALIAARDPGPAREDTA
jgi:hypothetical protein